MEFEREESAMECDDGVSMEEEVVEVAMPRRARGRGRLRAQTKTLDRRPNATAAATATQRSIEGWIVLITGIHEEAQEDDIFAVFGDYGAIKNLHMNLDRRTGFIKGYALIEYDNLMEAEAAIRGMNGAKLFGQTICVDPAFSTGPFGTDFRRLPQVNRSRSPGRNF